MLDEIANANALVCNIRADISNWIILYWVFELMRTSEGRDFKISHRLAPKQCVDIKTSENQRTTIENSQHGIDAVGR